MKKTFGALGISMLLLTGAVPVAAQPNFQKTAVDIEQERVEEQDYFKQFNNFMKDALEHIKTLRVNNQNGVDVTSIFKNIYDTQGSQAAHEFVQQNECDLSFNYEEDVDPNSKATIKAKNVYERFYECETCTDGTYTKEWDVELRGVYSYNVDTHKITSAKNPTLKLVVAEFGALWSAQMNNVSTSYSIINPTTIKFSGKYHMYGTLSPQTGVSITKDFKGHSVSFNSSI